MSQLTFGRGPEVVPAGAGADWQWQERMPSAADFKAMGQYFTDPKGFRKDFDPFRKDSQGNWDPKPLLRIGAVLGIGLFVLAGCNLLQQQGKSPDNNQFTPTPGDCPWLTGAVVGLSNELSSQPMIVDQQTLNNPDVLQADIRTCIDQGTFQRISQDNDLAVIGMAAPGNEEGQIIIQPIWAVVNKSATEGTAPLRLFSADRSKTTISQNGAEVVMQLHPVSIQDGKIVSNESLDQATLADIGDGNYRLDHNGRSLNLTADELGQMIGGGFLIGAMEEFKSVIAADQLEFSQATRFNGVSPKEFLGIEKPQGVPEVLPQDVLQLAMEMGLRPVYYGTTEISSFCSAQSCEVMLYDHLVNTAAISESTNGQAGYTLNNQPDTTAIYRFESLPEGIYPVAFIAADDNKYGAASGTVMVLFYTGGGKTGAQVLNLDNPLKPLVNEPNRAEVIVTDKELTMTTFDANGQVLEDGIQEVSFLPPLPDWAQALPQGTQVEIATDGTTTITELFWMKDFGLDKNEYDISFDQETLAISAFRAGTSQDDPKNLIFQAIYDSDKKAWDAGFEIHFAVETAKRNCKPTNFTPVFQSYNHYGVDPQDESSFLQFFSDLMASYPFSKTGRFLPVVIDKTNKCWGWIIENNFDFVYRDKSDLTVKIVPLMDNWESFFEK